MDVTGSNELALLTKERRIVYGEQHAHCRLVNGDRRQCLRIFIVADRISDLKSFDTYQRTNVTGRNFRNFHTPHAFKSMQFLNLWLDDRTVAFRQRYVHAFSQSAAMHTAYGNTTGIRGIVQWCHQHLRRTFQLRGSRDILQDTIQQRINIIRRLLPVGAHPVIFCRTVNNGEIQLVFRCFQAEHQVEYHFIDFFGTTVRLVHLVHNNDGFQADLQSFLQYKTRLRHRTLKSVHQQDTSVGHVQYAFHLTAEVAVPRSVDNINLSVFIIDRNVFGKDCYSSLTLQIIVIQH